MFFGGVAFGAAGCGVACDAAGCGDVFANAGGRATIKIAVIVAATTLAGRLNRLVARKNRKRMAASSAGDHDLEMRFLANASSVVGPFFEAAETASR